MGIPLGHKLKIIKRIKDIRLSKGLSVPQSAQSTRTKASEIEYNEGSSIRPVTNNVYEVLPDPTEMSQSTQESNVPAATTNQKEPEFQKERKVTFAENTNNSLVGVDTLLSGDYNEADSHAGFLEALNAWRKVGKEETPKKTKDGKLSTSDVQKAWKHQQDPTKKGSFFANIDSKQTDFNLGSIPTWQEGGTMPDKKLVSNKESCWQCYKLYDLDIDTSEFKDGSKVSQYHYLSYFWFCV